MTRHIEPHTEPADEQLKRLEDRIAGRKMGRDLFSLIKGGDAASRQYMESLIEELQRQNKLLHPAPPPPENHTPITRLGSTIMPFGIHAGKSFDDVPLEYLDWLCRSQEDFYKTLRSYLRHPELESRRRGETTFIEENPDGV